MQLQRFAAARNSLIHQISEGKFMMIVIMSRYFEIFTSCQGSMRNFSKHHYKCKTVSTKFIVREETASKTHKTILLVALTKIPESEGNIHHPAFMGNCRTISHKFCSPIYPMDEENDDLGLVSDNILLFLELFDF